MKVICTNIDWGISDSDMLAAFGRTTDDNGLPYTAKDFGLPAWDEEVEIDADDLTDDITPDGRWRNIVEMGEDIWWLKQKMFAYYGWEPKSLRWEERHD